MDEARGINNTLFVGGPVEQESLHFIYNKPLEIEGAIEVMEDLWWGGNFDQLKGLMQDNIITSNEVRFFLGYSGWAKDNWNQN